MNNFSKVVSNQELCRTCQVGSKPQTHGTGVHLPFSMMGSQYGFVGVSEHLQEWLKKSFLQFQNPTVDLPSLKLTMAPGNRPSQEEMTSSNHPFSGAILVSVLETYLPKVLRSHFPPPGKHVDFVSLFHELRIRWRGYTSWLPDSCSVPVYLSGTEQAPRQLWFPSPKMRDDMESNWSPKATRIFEMLLPSASSSHSIHSSSCALSSRRFLFFNWTQVGNWHCLGLHWPWRINRDRFFCCFCISVSSSPFGFHNHDTGLPPWRMMEFSRVFLSCEAISVIISPCLLQSWFSPNAM